MVIREGVYLMKKFACLLVALTILLCTVAPCALADGKVWENCTVGLTKVAPGDVIKSNVVFIDDTGKNLGSYDLYVHCGSEGKLDLGYDSTSGWVGWGAIVGKPILETINSKGWAGPFTELPVINNIFYQPPETADSTHIVLWGAVMTVSALCAMVLVKRKDQI